jgi:hypothetical protein
MKKIDSYSKLEKSINDFIEKVGSVKIASEIIDKIDIDGSFIYGFDKKFTKQHYVIFQNLVNISCEVWQINKKSFFNKFDQSNGKKARMVTVFLLRDITGLKYKSLAALLKFSSEMTIYLYIRNVRQSMEKWKMMDAGDKYDLFFSNFFEIKQRLENSIKNAELINKILNNV